MLTKGNEKALGMVCQIDNEELPPNLLKLEQVGWYTDISFYLKNLTCPSHLVGHKKRSLRFKSSKYVLTRDGLGWNNLDVVILRCVDDVESKKLMDEFHGSFVVDILLLKILPTKSSKKDIIGPQYFQMYIILLGNVSRVMFLEERKS
jgi:hypothetical protein